MAMPDPRAPRVLIDARATVAGLSAPRVAAAVARAWSLHHGPPGVQLEIVFLDEAEHVRCHGELMGDPSPTDVMAIAYRDADLWGEILVNAECAQREAAARGVRAADEALLYVVHGALHLLGYDDLSPDAARAMRAAEARVLSR